MMQDCRRYLDQADHWLNGELAPSIADQLRLHFEQCESCDSEISLRQTTRRLLQASDVPEVSREFSSRLHAELSGLASIGHSANAPPRVETSIEMDGSGAGLSYFNLAAAAAMCAVLFVGAISVFNLFADPAAIAVNASPFAEQVSVSRVPPVVKALTENPVTRARSGGSQPPERPKEERPEVVALPHARPLLTSTPSAVASESVPIRLPITGQLEDAPPAPSTVTLVVSVYSDRTSDQALWRERQQVDVDAQGRYSAMAGASVPDGIPKAIFEAGGSRWMGVAVLGYLETERQMLVVVPYALRTADAETLAGESSSGFLPPDALVRRPSQVTTGNNSVGGEHRDAPEWTPPTLRAETEITVRTIDPIDSERLRDGEEIVASFDEPLSIGGAVVAAVGTPAFLQITRTHAVSGQPSVALEFVGFEMDGKRVAVGTGQAAIAGASRAGNAAKQGAVGSIVGGILGGRLGGAVKGAAVGATAGMSVATLTPKRVVVPAETRLTFTTSRSVGLTPVADAPQAARAAAGIAASAPPAPGTLVATDQDVMVKVERCYKQATAAVYCQFTVTNQRADRQISLRAVSLIDTDGVGQGATQAQFGATQSQFESAGARTSVTAIYEVPMVLHAQFGGVLPTVTSLARLTVSLNAAGTEVTATFRSVPLAATK